MFDFLEKLRAKPDKVKKQISFFLALTFAGIIFAIWLSVIYPDFRLQQSHEQKVANLEPSPLSAFSETVSASLAAVLGQFSKIKSIISSFSTSSVYYSATTTDLTGTTTSQ